MVVSAHSQSAGIASTALIVKFFVEVACVKDTSPSHSIALNAGLELIIVPHAYGKLEFILQFPTLVRHVQVYIT